MYLLLIKYFLFLINLHFKAILMFKVYFCLWNTTLYYSSSFTNIISFYIFNTFPFYIFNNFYFYIFLHFLFIFLIHFLSIFLIHFFSIFLIHFLSIFLILFLSILYLIIFLSIYLTWFILIFLTLFISTFRLHPKQKTAFFQSNSINSWETVCKLQNVSLPRFAFEQEWLLIKVFLKTMTRRDLMKIEGLESSLINGFGTWEDLLI